MADIGTVHHHAAHQRELFNGRPNEVDVSPELTPVIRQGFKHAAACGRAFAVGEIVRMAFERAQMDFRAAARAWRRRSAPSQGSGAASARHPLNRCMRAGKRAPVPAYPQGLPCARFRYRESRASPPTMRWCRRRTPCARRQEVLSPSIAPNNAAASPAPPRAQYDQIEIFVAGATGMHGEKSSRSGLRLLTASAASP